MSKRKCKFTEVLRAKYPCFTSGRDEFDAKCSICDCHVDVGNKGTTALERHVATEKHKKMIRAASSSSKVTNFFQPSTSLILKNTHAAEGTLAFHTIKHHQSYNSMECTASLTRKMFADSETAKNLKCGKTKTEAIVNQVVAPHTITTIIETLRNISCLSVATDASNHGADQLFPILIQYFNWTGNGIETKILDLQTLPNETSLSICVAFIGDNANVNFGGVNRNPGQNVFTRLKESLEKEHLTGVEFFATKPESISNEFISVYKACEDYLMEWITPLEDFKGFEWMTLLKENENLKYDDLLHDQFCNLISFLKSKSNEDEAYFDLKLHEQWTIYFKSVKNIECFSELLKICEFYFCISAHNANVERVFSLINTQWSKERNRLSVQSVKSIILTQYNFINMSCEDFYNYLLKNKELLSKIGSSAKYD
ncbi:hypothetical protein ABMA27_003361 [Loxostege sticticalis]|uniref:HAT C-terminal dimerisation domain-containing protein n=1 Tax=Loxostege sticticalis TaxID=481309 RepID=A0ABR3HSW2_LOXSC